MLQAFANAVMTTPGGDKSTTANVCRTSYARRQRFNGLNEFIQARDGWMVSIQGACEMQFSGAAGISAAGEAHRDGISRQADRRERAHPADRDHATPRAVIERRARGADRRLDQADVAGRHRRRDRDRRAVRPSHGAKVGKETPLRAFASSQE